MGDMITGYEVEGRPIRVMGPRLFGGPPVNSGRLGGCAQWTDDTDEADDAPATTPTTTTISGSITIAGIHFNNIALGRTTGDGTGSDDPIAAEALMVPTAAVATSCSQTLLSGCRRRSSQASTPSPDLGRQMRAAYRPSDDRNLGRTPKTIPMWAPFTTRVPGNETSVRHLPVRNGLPWRTLTATPSSHWKKVDISHLDFTAADEVIVHRAALRAVHPARY